MVGELGAQVITLIQRALVDLPVGLLLIIDFVEAALALSDLKIQVTPATFKRRAMVLCLVPNFCALVPNFCALVPTWYPTFSWDARFLPDVATNSSVQDSRFKNTTGSRDTHETDTNQPQNQPHPPTHAPPVSYRLTRQPLALRARYAPDHTRTPNANPGTHASPHTTPLTRSSAMVVTVMATAQYGKG